MIFRDDVWAHLFNATPDSFSSSLASTESFCSLNMGSRSSSSASLSFAFWRLFFFFWGWWKRVDGTMQHHFQFDLVLRILPINGLTINRHLKRVSVSWKVDSPAFSVSLSPQPQLAFQGLLRRAPQKTRHHTKTMFRSSDNPASLINTKRKVQYLHFSSPSCPFFLF